MLRRASRRFAIIGKGCGLVLPTALCFAASPTAVSSSGCFVLGAGCYRTTSTYTSIGVARRLPTPMWSKLRETRQGAVKTGVQERQ